MYITYKLLPNNDNGYCFLHLIAFIGIILFYLLTDLHACMQPLPSLRMHARKHK